MTDWRGMTERGATAAVAVLALLSGALVVNEWRDTPPSTAEPAITGTVAEARPPEVIPPRADTSIQADATLQIAAEPAPAPVPEPASAVETGSVSSAQLASIDPAARDRLSAVLASWKTRHPDQLVGVIADLAEREELPHSPAFLLSIAYAETRGRILAVSPAGAVGLAQATPAAYLSEGFDGKVFMTNSYLVGSRAYIMKKPLGDALTIAEPLLRRNNAVERAHAKKQLAKAKALRTEGMDELEALRPVANDTFYERIAEMDKYNVAILGELERIIDRGAPRASLKRFHTRVQKDYRYYQNLQSNGWSDYERALSARRDQLLRKKFGQNPERIFLTRQYEAGEYLGTALDARFSPSKMAEFLAVHLATKQRQAIELGLPEENIDAWTAALYNGGSVNIRRMRAGLIGRLTETEKYMKNVPARSARLQQAMG